MQRRFKDRDVDLQRRRYHHFVVRFWVLDAVGNRLDDTRGFPDEVSSPNTRGNPTRPAMEWHDTILLHGTVHCWEVGSVESSSMVWTCVPNGRFPPAETAYVQNVRLVGAVLLMHQGSNGRTRSLLTGRIISPDDSLPYRLLGGGRRHDIWVRRMAGVMVQYHRHQLTSWPIKQAHTSRCLERCWISANPICYPASTVNFFWFADEKYLSYLL